MWYTLIIIFLLLPNSAFSSECEPPRWYQKITSAELYTGLGQNDLLGESLRQASQEIFFQALGLTEAKLMNLLREKEGHTGYLDRSRLKAASYFVFKNLASMKDLEKKTIRKCRLYFAKIQMKQKDLKVIADNKRLISEYVYLAILGHRKEVRSQLTWYKNTDDRAFRIPNRNRKIEQSYKRIKMKLSGPAEDIRILLLGETKKLETSHRKLYSTQSYYKQKTFEKIIQRQTRGFDDAFSAFALFQSNRKKEARKHLQNLASNRNPHAAYILARIFEGRKEDQETAFHWMKTSAHQSYEKGVLGLAEYYSRGIGVTKNPEKSMEIYRSDELANNPEAFYQEALHLQKNGPMTKNEYLRSKNLIEKAVLMGHPKALQLKENVTISKPAGITESPKTEVKVD